MGWSTREVLAGLSGDPELEKLVRAVAREERTHVRRWYNAPGDCELRYVDTQASPEPQRRAISQPDAIIGDRERQLRRLELLKRLC